VRGEENTGEDSVHVEDGEDAAELEALMETWLSPSALARYILLVYT
jgi:hypothetical protein